MRALPQQLIQEVFTASNEGRLHFGAVIKQLIEAGVESYTVDYRSHQTTYHLKHDASLVFEIKPHADPIAKEFSALGLQAAIKGAQSGTVLYPEFKGLSMQAGCIGYTVWITGRHVSYYGRNGETHVERFPS